MKKIIITAVIALTVSVSAFAQKKLTVKPVTVNSDSVKVAGADLKRFFQFTINLVNNTPTGALTDSVATKNAATGKLGAVPISNFVTTSTGRIGTATLSSGTIAISITGITTSSRAFVTRTVATGTSLTTGVTAVCTSGTLTITADVAAGTINVVDGSTYNYQVIN